MEDVGERRDESKVYGRYRRGEGSYGSHGKFLNRSRSDRTLGIALTIGERLIADH